MEPDNPGGAAALGAWMSLRDTRGADGAAAEVEALYADHAVSLIRLAYLMLGDRAAAEDAVQDAFCGLYRQWDRLADPGRALGYVRTAVLNGCRSALRRRVTSRRLTQLPAAGRLRRGRGAQPGGARGGHGRGAAAARPPA